MTPAARVQTATEILDTILSGRAAEQALTGWARRSRFAGSKDRAAVRDLVFDALRSRRSLAALGGSETGRGLMLGLCRRDGTDPDTLFTGTGYGPAVLDDDERDTQNTPDSDAERLDIPDWLWPRFVDSVGDQAEAAALALQHRAPVHLRVNLRKGDRECALAALAQDGITCTPHPASPSALNVWDGARKVRNSAAYQQGLIELQDAASQAVVDALPVRDGMRILDFCAGGGGKALAIAARAEVSVFAYDADPDRMQDLPTRAERAGVEIVQITRAEAAAHAPFDIVLIDVPCSGSGAWRRAPEGKWRLTPEQLDDLLIVQSSILDQAAPLVADDGVLAYATCSLLSDENSAQIDRFLGRHTGWQCLWQKSWSVTDGTDGFFAAHLTARA